MSAPAELVTVLVPARNEERSIAGCLESILSQDYPALQVIVLDAASRDTTAEVVREVERRDTRVSLVRHSLEGIPESLNLGLAHARGRWLVRVDAHSRIAPGYVRRVVDHLREGGWGGVGGRKDGVASSPTGRAIAQALGSRFGVGNSRYHYGTERDIVDHIPFGAYPTELLRALGGWNGSLRANEDFELDYRIRRLGHKLLFDPTVRIFWETRESIPDLFRQYRRYGRGKAEVALLHPHSLEARHLAPPGLVLYLVGASLIAPWRPIVALAASTPYVAALAAACAIVAKRERDLQAAPWLPPAFLSMHLGWGLGFWEELIRHYPRTRGRESSPSSPGLLQRIVDSTFASSAQADIEIEQAPAPSRRQAAAAFPLVAHHW
jgi:succinoglycan biosynthesis protein ExoA